MHLYGIGVCVCAYACLFIKGAEGSTCDSPWQEYFETCYLRFNTNQTWKNAMLTCMNSGDQLVVVDNEGLNTFIHQNVTNGSDVWLGLINGNASNVNDWTWSDGQNVAYIDDWNAAPMNSLCAIMKLTADQKTPYWHTQLCSYLRGFVCEKDMVNHTCDNMWLDYETHCYLVISDMDRKMSNTAAARYCWNKAAYLVSINNQSEAEFLYTNIQTGAEYWIGLSPLKWLDGTPLQWNNWDELGPNKDASCVYMNHSTGKWSSGSCEGRRRFVCQQDILDSTTMSVIMSTQFSSTSPSKDTTIKDYEETTMHENKSNSEEVSDFITINPTLPETFLLTVVTPTVTGCIIIIIIVIIAGVLVVLRRKRSSKSQSKDSEQEKQTKSIHDTTIDVYETVEHIEHTHPQSVTKCSTAAHGHEEMVRGPADTVVVNGDVYAIVDKEKPNPVFIKDAAKSNKIGKLDIAKGQGHIIIGSDVYAIVDKDRVVPNEAQKPKQKKKKPSPPPKLEDNSDELISKGHNHIVVGSDVYTVVDKDKDVPNEPLKPKQKKKKPSPNTQLVDKSEKVIPNGQSHIVVGSDVYAIVDKENTQSKQHTPKQKKNNPTPLKLKDKSDDLNNENVYYNEFNMNTTPTTSTKHNGKNKKQTEQTGVIYADLDLTGSVCGHGQGRGNDEDSGVVYADVRS